MKKIVKSIVALLAINTLIYVFCITVQSCKKSETTSDKTLTEVSKFKTELLKTKAKISKKSLTNGTHNNSNFSTESNSSSLLTFYMNFGNFASTNTQTQFTQANTVEQIADLANSFNAKIEYMPNTDNIAYVKQVDIESLVDNLQPLLQTSKEYLYTKGFSELELQTMIKNENAQELDLIPFAMAISSVDQGNTYAKNSNNVSFFNTAYAQTAPPKPKPSFTDCALKAIGVDFLFSAATAPNHSWGKEAMTKAFIAIAKRMLGPWGVLVAVAQFALCMSSLD